MEKVLRRVKDQGSGMWEPGDITALPTGGRVGAWITNEETAAEIQVIADIGSKNCKMIPFPIHHILTLKLYCGIPQLSEEKSDSYSLTTFTFNKIVLNSLFLLYFNVYSSSSMAFLQKDRRKIICC